MSDPFILRGGEAFRKGSGTSPEDELELWRTLLDFLSRNELATTLPESKESADPIDFIELRHSNLTPTGLPVLRAELSKWLAGMDRGNRPSKTAALEKAFKTVMGK